MVRVAWWELLWATWDLRVVILFSLVLQIFLILFAPLRKRVSPGWITTLLWFGYLLADSIATYAVGLITRSLSDTSGPLTNPSLLAFWAPFLLLHLGGPDTITAFALEDNELWLRHLFSLGSQCSLVAYAFIQSFSDHKFWLPTLLMFVSGVIRYTERTRAFYLASSRKFKASLLAKPDPGPNYAKLMDEMKNPNTRLRMKIEWTPESTRVNRSRTKEDWAKLTDLKVVQVAHQYFLIFHGLIADSTFSFRERNLTRDFFLKRTARDAFKVVEVELNFFYEILYTKAAVVHGMLGYLPRILSFIFNCATIVIFYLIDKKKIEKIDVRISYSLLLGAIALDLIAFVIFLYSDWTSVALTKSAHPNWFIEILRKLLRVERVRWPKTTGKSGCFPLGIMAIMRRRWSESLSKYNLVNCCLHPRAKWLEATIGRFGLTNMLDELKYVEHVEFTDDLRDLIFNELKLKSEQAENLDIAKDIFSARGSWILERESHRDLLRWINEVDFDESLILWHIATDLCYYTNEVNTNTNDGTPNSDKKDIKDYRELSKVLSDYMLYLLIMQSTMLSEVAGIGQTRFSDTCAEAKRFFREKGAEAKRLEKKGAEAKRFFREKGAEAKRLEKKGEKSEEEKSCCLSISNFGKCFCGIEPHCCCNKCCSKWENNPDELQKEACKSILAVDTLVEPFAVKRDQSKSVLFDACMLAKELKKLKRQTMWEIISKVWVELLCYAACHCRANIHVAQLSKGGQLLTLVWLMMAHLGLGDHFQIRDGHARAKLIVKN